MHTVETSNSLSGFAPVVPDPQPDPPNNFIWLRTLQALPRLVGNPITAFGESAFKEPLVYSQIFNQRLALVHDPALLRHIFIENAGSLEADSVRQAVLKPALREGMLTAEGHLWRKARKAIAPVFSPRHVRGFATAMDKVTQDFIEQTRVSDQPVRLADMMTHLTYLVLSETLFSGELDADSDQVIADVDQFLQHLSRPDPFDYLNAPDWVPRLTKLRGRGALKRLREAVRNTAEQRRKKVRQMFDVPEDFLTLLLRTGDAGHDGLSLDEIEDNIITFIGAGHETTARALAWTIYLLSQDSDARERCETEANALNIEDFPPHDWAAQTPWITACFEEAMRLFPPAGIISRVLSQPINFQDQRINAGATVICSPWVLHRHEMLWQKAGEFHPARFLGDNRAAINRFAYLPFGLGQRVCIGASFAMQEAVIILVRLLRQFRFDYVANKPPWPVMKITIQPDNGIPMRISRRT